MSQTSIGDLGIGKAQVIESSQSLRGELRPASLTLVLSSHNVLRRVNPAKGETPGVGDRIAAKVQELQVREPLELERPASVTADCPRPSRSNRRRCPTWMNSRSENVSAPLMLGHHRSSRLPKELQATLARGARRCQCFGRSGIPMSYSALPPAFR